MVTSVVFSDPYPSGGIKKYGLTHTLSILATISGSDSCLNDFTFYLADNSNIGPTISGTICTDTYSVVLSTLSGVDYSWYASTTVSGETYTSSIYTFYVRYLCSGICNVNSMPASGITINLHRRLDGQLVNITTTAGTGRFSIDSSFNEEHYIVALHPDSDTNALIYDKILPE